MIEEAARFIVRVDISRARPVARLHKRGDQPLLQGLSIAEVVRRMLAGNVVGHDKRYLRQSALVQIRVVIRFRIVRDARILIPAFEQLENVIAVSRLDSIAERARLLNTIGFQVILCASIRSRMMGHSSDPGVELLVVIPPLVPLAL